MKKPMTARQIAEAASGKKLVRENDEEIREFADEIEADIGADERIDGWANQMISDFGPDALAKAERKYNAAKRAGKPIEAMIWSCIHTMIDQLGD